jgi:hypothetical protein
LVSQWAVQWQRLESASEKHTRVVSIADDVVVLDVGGSCGTVQVEVGGAPWLTGLRVRLVLGGQGVDDDYFGQPGFFGDFSLDGLAEGSAGVGAGWWSGSVGCGASGSPAARDAGQRGGVLTVDGAAVAGRSARGWAGGELDCFRDEDRTCTMRRCEHGVPAELHLYAGA